VPVWTLTASAGVTGFGDRCLSNSPIPSRGHSGHRDRPEPLSAARAIGDEAERVRALAALAPQLPESRRVEVLAEALSAAQAIGHEYWRAQALAALAPQLPEGRRAEVLAEALRPDLGVAARPPD
jgi:hypothetical protein